MELIDRNIYKYILTFIDSARDHCSLSLVCKFFYENRKDLTSDLEQKTEHINYCSSFYTVIRGTNVRHGLYERKIALISEEDNVWSGITASYDRGELLSVTYILDEEAGAHIVYKDGMAHPYRYYFRMIGIGHGEKMPSFCPKKKFWDAEYEEPITDEEFLDFHIENGGFRTISQWAWRYFEDVKKKIDNRFNKSVPCKAKVQQESSNEWGIFSWNIIDIYKELLDMFKK